MSFVTIRLEVATECWKGEGRYDWSYAEQMLALCERQGGEAQWLIALELGTVPPWFAQAYPSEVHDVAGGAVLANVVSPLWKDKVCCLAGGFAAWLMSTRWAKRVAGLALTAGGPDGWRIHDAEETVRGRYHPAYTREFQAWLRRTYGDEAALRAAWNDPCAAFDSASCPTVPMRKRSHADGPFSLRDPAAERPAIDYYRFLNTTLADHFVAVCRAAKETAGDHILCGGFGNALWSASGVYSYAQECGHALVHRVRESPWVDFLSISDFRFPISDCSPQAHAEVAFVCSGDTPMFQAAMSEELLRYELACHRPLLLGVAAEQWRLAGVPFDIWELHDLARPDFPGERYHLLVFVNCAYVSQPAAAGIRRWQNGDRVLCWTYAPAVIWGPQSSSSSSLVLETSRRLATCGRLGAPWSLDPGPGAELIGMRLGWRRERRQIRVMVDASGYPLTEGGEALSFGTEGSVGPVFFADDADACVFGRLRDGGEPAFALRHHDGWRSIYLAMLNFGPQLLRNLARFAGAGVRQG